MHTMNRNIIRQILEAKRVTKKKQLYVYVFEGLMILYSHSRNLFTMGENLKAKTKALAEQS